VASLFFTNRAKKRKKNKKMTESKEYIVLIVDELMYEENTVGGRTGWVSQRLEQPKPYMDANFRVDLPLDLWTRKHRSGVLSYRTPDEILKAYDVKSQNDFEEVVKRLLYNTKYHEAYMLIEHCSSSVVMFVPRMIGVFSATTLHVFESQKKANRIIELSVAKLIKNRAFFDMPLDCGTVKLCLRYSRGPLPLLLLDRIIEKGCSAAEVRTACCRIRVSIRHLRFLTAWMTRTNLPLAFVYDFGMKDCNNPAVMAFMGRLVKRRHLRNTADVFDDKFDWDFMREVCVRLSDDLLCLFHDGFSRKGFNELSYSTNLRVFHRRHFNYALPLLQAGLPVYVVVWIIEFINIYTPIDEKSVALAAYFRYFTQLARVEYTERVRKRWIQRAAAAPTAPKFRSYEDTD
jgi:hypothetical protein